MRQRVARVKRDECHVTPTPPRVGSVLLLIWRARAGLGGLCIRKVGARLLPIRRCWAKFGDLWQGLVRFGEVRRVAEEERVQRKKVQCVTTPYEDKISFVCCDDVSEGEEPEHQITPHP